MRKLMVVLLILASMSLFMASTVFASSETPYFSAKLIYNDGTVVNAHQVLEAPGYRINRYNKLEVIIGKEVHSVPFSDIKEFSVIEIGPEKSYFRMGGVQSCTGSCRAHILNLVLKNGREFQALSKSYINDIEVKTLNPLTNEESTQKHYIRQNEVRKIVLSDEVGFNRINPNSNRVWPASFNFDPISGEALVWGDE